MHDDRLAAIRSLIDLSAPLEQMAQRLRQFSWDYDDAPVELCCAHLVSILRRYLNGELSAQDVEDWANLIEGREDIQVAQISADWISATLHELANPFLHGPLDQKRAGELIERAPV